MDQHEREEAAIGAAISHLVGRYGDQIPSDELETTVRACYARWPDAHVRDFIPVLAERRAKEQLDRRARQRRR